MAKKKAGRRSDKPTFLDPATHKKLIELAARATLFLGESVSPSAATRYAISALLAEEAKVWSDLGEPDKAEVRRLLMEARSCQYAQEPK
jgi:hypothetical protein